MSDELVLERRPRYSRRSVLMWVNSHARAIAKENDGRIPDVFMLDARLGRDLDLHPEMYDRDQWVRHCRKHWEKVNHKVLTRDGVGGLFVPGAFITIGTRVRAMMKKILLPTDLVAWQTTEDEAAANFRRTMDRRTAYRMDRIKEAASNPDCTYLGDLESKLHGYVETITKEETHLTEDEKDD